jgi:cyclophilin family peptidyl-prolyl cis-trans isomerase
MSTRLIAALALIVLSVSPVAAQTMRFTTNVGSFDMELNPNNDANLQPLVDNIVAYIGLGRYHHSAINRAVENNPGTQDDFVLQMGGFLGFPIVPELWAELHNPIETLTPVTVDGDGDGQVDFSAISNTRGTVSLALQSGNPNSGTSSFFVNLGNNDFLDLQGFVPFARIDDMTTIDRIMQLSQRDLSGLAGQSGSLTYTDVPITEQGTIVVLKKVEVIDAAADFSFVGPIASALQMEQRAAANAASSANASLAAAPPAASIAATPVPEPSTVALGLAAATATLLFRRRRAVRRATA